MSLRISIILNSIAIIINGISILRLSKAIRELEEIDK